MWRRKKNDKRNQQSSTTNKNVTEQKPDLVPTKPPRVLSGGSSITATIMTSSMSSSTASSSSSSNLTPNSPHSSCSPMMTSSAYSMTSSGNSSGTLSTLSSPRGDQQGNSSPLSTPSNGSVGCNQDYGFNAGQIGGLVDNNDGRPDNHSQYNGSTASLASSVTTVIDNFSPSRNNGNRYSANLSTFQNQNLYTAVPLRSPFVTRRSNFKPCSSSRPSSHHGTPTRRSHQTSTLLASLDKSILQIRDWLTVLEDMLQTDRVDIADVVDICRLVERQRNVLRELEQKKPQLDDLVKTAENLRESPIRQQIPAKEDNLEKSKHDDDSHKEEAILSSSKPLWPHESDDPEPQLLHIRTCLKERRRQRMRSEPPYSRTALPDTSTSSTMSSGALPTKLPGISYLMDMTSSSPPRHSESCNAIRNARKRWEREQFVKLFVDTDESRTLSDPGSEVSAASAGAASPPSMSSSADHIVSNDGTVLPVKAGSKSTMTDLFVPDLQIVEDSDVIWNGEKFVNKKAYYARKRWRIAYNKVRLDILEQKREEIRKESKEKAIDENTEELIESVETSTEKSDSHTNTINRKWRLILQRLEEETNERSRHLWHRSQTALRKNLSDQMENAEHLKAVIGERSKTLKLRSIKAADKLMRKRSRSVSKEPRNIFELNGARKTPSNTFDESIVISDSEQESHPPHRGATFRPTARSKTRSNRGVVKSESPSPERRDYSEVGQSRARKSRKDDGEKKRSLRSRSLSLLRSMKNRATRGKSKSPVSQLREHWEDTSEKVNSRKNELEDLLVDNQQFDSKRKEVESWLNRMDGWYQRMRPVATSPDLIEAQVREQKSFHAELHQHKGQIEEFNQMTQELISNYNSDDTSKIKKIAETVNQRYDRLNQDIMSRGKKLHSGLSSSQSIQPAMDSFLTWVSDMELRMDNIEHEAMKNKKAKGPGAEVAKTDIKKYMDLQGELDTERDTFVNITNTGKKILTNLDGTEDSTLLKKRLDEMNQRWNYLKAKSIAIRNRLENNTDHWNSLYLSLRELAEWTIGKEAELEAMGPVGGDEATIKKQQDDLRAFRRQLEDKRAVIENNLLTGRQHLNSNEANNGSNDSNGSEDGGQVVNGTGPGGEGSNDSSEPDTPQTMTTKDLNKAIRTEVNRLNDRWNSLWHHTESWARKLDDTLPKVLMFQKSVEAVMQRLTEAEVNQAAFSKVSANAFNEASVQAFRNQLKAFSNGLSPLQRLVEDINDQASDFTANNVQLSSQVLSRLEDINTRWKLVQLGLDEHYKKLNDLKRSTSSGRMDNNTAAGAGNGSDGNAPAPNPAQDFLSVAVHYPWARAVSQNKVPYYINHQTETTHWDHPEMVALFKSLTEFNSVRFSAYRTAMKLRQVQKKLGLHFLHLNVAIEAFDAHGLRGQNDKLLDVTDMITVLSSLYEAITASGNVVNVPLCLDLTLNWMLNVYDCQRTGHVRVLSFKIAVAVMCQGPLEEKYRYMFRLIADQHRRASERKLAHLLHDCVQIPRVLGEITAFGGNNVEPSVKSCFEKAGKESGLIEALHFLNWMKQEPQSMVWLPVLHRFVAAESAKHAAKCNICKQSPILGFRYRCLKCFNFDMCQNCFFAGKGGRYKSHKMTHPMQEYCTTTTSGEDMRDFTKLLKNKFKSKKYFQQKTRLGYLPVQQNQSSLDLSEHHSLSLGMHGVNAAAADSPSLSPQRSVSRHEVGDRLVDRLAELDTRSASDDSTSTRVTPQQHSEPKKSHNGIFADEHSLIAQYCQKLNNGDLTSTVPDSPMQLLEEINREQTHELELMIRELETENANLQEEYQHLKASSSSSTSGTSGLSSGGSAGMGGGGHPGGSTDADILNEAKMLREHKERLESRMRILEEHNQQLCTQLSKLKQFLQEPPLVSSTASAMITTNKTGTLNTKAVTASQLATNSPLLPHKMSGQYYNAGDSDRSDPPALPPRGLARPVSRDGSLTRDNNLPGLSGKPTPPAVPPKRSSLTRSDLALFDPSSRTNSLPRRDPRQSAIRSRDVSLSRGSGAMMSMSGASSGQFHSGGSNYSMVGSHHPSWTDSLPRRDFYNVGGHVTGSLPRRDKAGLGRPEPPSNLLHQTHGPNQNGSRRDTASHWDQKLVFGPKEKRNSTGNLYFTDTIGNEKRSGSKQPDPLQVLTHSLKSNGRIGSHPSISGNPGDDINTHSEVSRELQTAAGDLGKELKNLITLMDQEEAEEARQMNKQVKKTS